MEALANYHLVRHQPISVKKIKKMLDSSDLRTKQKLMVTTILLSIPFQTNGKVYALSTSFLKCLSQ